MLMNKNIIWFFFFFTANIRVGGVGERIKGSWDAQTGARYESSVTRFFFTRFHEIDTESRQDIESS